MKRVIIVPGWWRESDWCTRLVSGERVIMVPELVADLPELKTDRRGVLLASRPAVQRAGHRSVNPSAATHRRLDHSGS